MQVQNFVENIRDCIKTFRKEYNRNIIYDRKDNIWLSNYGLAFLVFFKTATLGAVSLFIFIFSFRILVNSNVQFPRALEI